MKLQLVRHLWGIDLGADPTALFDHWQKHGYEALEFALISLSGRDVSAFLSLMDRFAFQWIPQVYTEGATVDEHVSSLRRSVEECLKFAPLFINAHSGSDAWSQAEATEFYGRALELEASLGITVSHETHRMRYFSTPWNTRHILEQYPRLKVTCDFSHWVCVSERLLPDCAEIISLTARHAHFLHARVGHEQGPQVSDPRAPEWQGHLHAHEAWWDEVWHAQRQAGYTVSPLVPEFGPPPYLPTLPYSQMPVADLAEICDWMARRQASRFAAQELS